MRQSTEEFDRLAQLDVIAREVFQPRASGRCLPRLTNRYNASCCAARMGKDAAARKIHDIERLCTTKCLFCLTTPLPGRYNGHCKVPTKHRSEASFNRLHNGIVRLTELVFQSVDVQLVHSGQSPQFLIGGELHPQRWMARVHSPA